MLILILAWIAIIVPSICVLYVVLAIVTNEFEDWKIIFFLGIGLCIGVLMYFEFSWGLNYIRDYKPKKNPAQHLENP